MRRRTGGRDVWLALRMALVLATLAAFYLAVAALIGLAVDRDWNRDWRVFCLPPGYALLLWAHFRSADRIVLRTVRARDARDRELVGTVARLAALADIAPPAVKLSPLATPNALAVGTTRSRDAVVVTEQLTRTLEPEEIEAVLAHEVTHLANRDAAVLAAANSFRAIAGFFGDPRLIDPEARVDDGLRMKFARVLFTPFRWALLAVGTPLVLALSRYREYVADRGAALLTGRPEALMSALRKLADASPPELDLRAAGASAFWIVPVRRRISLLSDHPPLEKRLARLERLAREMGKVGR